MHRKRRAGAGSGGGGGGVRLIGLINNAEKIFTQRSKIEVMAKGGVGRAADGFAVNGCVVQYYFILVFIL